MDRRIEELASPDPISTKRATQLQLLSELSTRMQALLEADDFNDRVVHLIRQHLDFYGVQIWGARDDGAVELLAQVGAYARHLKAGDTIREGEGIIGEALSRRRTYLANDVTVDPCFTRRGFPVSTRSEVAVPILRGPELLGILNVESERLAAFDEDDVSTLEAIASQLAVAVTNRTLLARAREHTENMRASVEEKTRELRKANERILEQQRLLQRENRVLRHLVASEPREQEPVGTSAAVLGVIAMVDKIAPTTASVLVQGESGTGKELVARRLHEKSERRDRPYVTVNCGALQESLLESELFGHEKGAFTGAVGLKIGLCETADGGTLFLDEIGELSLGIQAKLLRFLQEGEFYRIGGKRPLSVDVRIVSATNRDLEQEVREGRFREDLYYRLNTITLRMPPLRKRKEDIPLLVEYFLRHSRFGGSSSRVRQVDPQVIEAFRAYPWPGNIRELQNTMERLKILAEGPEVTLEDLPMNIRAPSFRAETGEYSVELPLEEIERHHILRSLAHHQGNKTKTAQALGITIKTLYNKLHRYGSLAGAPAEAGN